MSTFREFAAKVIERTRDELQADGLIDDKAGVLAGAMVDAATIAVQEWLLAQMPSYQAMTAGYEAVVAINDLIHEAGKVTP